MNFSYYMYCYEEEHCWSMQYFMCLELPEISFSKCFIILLRLQLYLTQKEEDL